MVSASDQALNKRGREKAHVDAWIVGQREIAAWGGGFAVELQVGHVVCASGTLLRVVTVARH